ncbi:NADH-quinone oxidoreductase subunit N [Polymorphobacter fuscus]|uniref:NADH-quinone oxidoreductase subunit N n=1 Tax=Sandarakinorhabdus fusca TaxID=1439888 RepID=A0A7C9GX53_9SPHN|nr:proton-conducting transporter membrane subunit [Polymorphobacter fuscus]KAB7643732.1 NADH-quinone oxidoreductase subunit N [Polymorphobacter fuscus]MQT18678.1 NADH-quinone oxidoreductase subunit N [Polymorphobacter fuscus]NJC08105.1 NADH-quinone oxidoreductase subunit N [Polymorphobacter fuscus]
MLTSGLVPLAIIGLTAVLAMLLAPRFGAATVRAAAATGLVLAAIAVIARIAAPEAPAPPLFADDGLARFGTLLASLSGLAVLGFLRGHPAAKEGPALVCIVALGAAALASATHVASLFLSLEIISLALIGLFVLPLTRGALEAGYKFLLPGAAGSAALLLGAAFAYADSGRLDFTAWHGPSLLAGFATALLLVGLGFKLSLVPFHVWAPDIYDGAPPAAAAIAGSAAKAGVVIAILRIDAGLPAQPVWHMGLAALATASILLGNLAALRQPSLSRMIGYSSVAHSGYLAAMIVCGAAQAPAAILFYLAAYVPAVVAALCVAASLGTPATIASLRGLAWRRPLAGGVLALALVSLAGLPVAIGFLAKLLLLEALMRSGAWGLFGAVIIGSGLGLYVYFRFFTALFVRDDPLPAPRLRRPEHAVLLLCGAMLLILGLYPAPLLDYLALAAG